MSSCLMLDLPVRITARTPASRSLLRSAGRVLIFLSLVMKSRFLPLPPIAWKISVSLAPSGSSGISSCPAYRTRPASGIFLSILPTGRMFSSAKMPRISRNVRAAHCVVHCFRRDVPHLGDDLWLLTRGEGLDDGGDPQAASGDRRLA